MEGPVTFHLILSLDYEVFGDGSGCLDRCLVDPTDACLAVADAWEAPLSLFADALELASFADLGDSAYTRVADQLARVVGSRHNLQLHLHPQWQDARRMPAGWQLDFHKWRIGDLAPRDIRDCIRRGLAYLKGFDTRPGRDLLAFRAGGWAIQPAAAVLAELAAAGLFIDSTVAPGLHNPARGDWYDFRAAPQLPCWPVADDVCRSDPRGALVEAPICCAGIGAWRHARALRERRRQPALPPGCIGSYDNPNDVRQQLWHKLGKLRTLGRAMLDFSSLPAWAMIAITERYMHYHEAADGPVPLVAIGHNKNFTAWSAAQLEAYLAWAARCPGLVFSDYGRWHQALLAEAPGACVHARRA